jgi:hypothetical protein
MEKEDTRTLLMMTHLTVQKRALSHFSKTNRQYWGGTSVRPSIAASSCGVFKKWPNVPVPKERKNAAHGASRGYERKKAPVPEGHKKTQANAPLEVKICRKEIWQR